ncbi:hypothetical protein J7E24_06360, partial [Hymenobacter sp. ISL-91]|nr:hypothetical protein [Hymenobacter sp. ISL-91]
RVNPPRWNKNPYNGNIAGQRWRAASDGVERAYGYRYDKLNRLLQGDYVARATPAAGWGAERGNYRFYAASYDAGGNLLTLRRRGLVATASRTVAAQFAETDNLRYRYASSVGSSAEPSSNRLLRVDDLAPAATAFGAKLPERPDFTDGATGGSQQPDYTYDAAGSLTSDLNKGIRLIRYNHLQLPERLEWTRCIVPERDGVFSGLEFRTNLWDKYSTAAPAQLRQYGPLSNVVRKAYKR